MLDATAARTHDGASVNWRQADALDLPFEDQTFDSVVCQLGVMFFPDRVRGYQEARRVLRPGGSFIFNAWDRIENSEVPYVIESTLIDAAPENPLVFMSRTPDGYFSASQIRADLEGAGRPDMTITTVDGTAKTTPSEAAPAFCEGTPLRAAIENHEALTLAEATKIAARALLRRIRCLGGRPGPRPSDHMSYSSPIRRLSRGETPGCRAHQVSSPVRARDEWLSC